MTAYLHAMRAARRMQDIPSRYLKRLPPHMRAGVLSQAKMAIMTGVGERHYRAFENRVERNIFSTELAEDVANILGASEAQMAALVAWAKHNETRELPEPKVDDAFRMHLDSQPYPGFIMRESNDILACNAAAAAAFPPLAEPGANWALWALGEGTGSADSLLDWREGWANLIIARLRLDQVRYWDNERLMQVIDTAKGNPRVREIWDSDCSMKSFSFGDVASVSLPEVGCTRVQVVTYKPALHEVAERIIMVIMVPLPD